jgi:hypothetical protein
MLLERQNVISTAIRSVGYEPATRTLEIEFQTGRVYRYSPVPRFVYRELMAAPVKGKYFHDHVQYSYTYEEVREQPEVC